MIDKDTEAMVSNHLMDFDLGPKRQNASELALGSTKSENTVSSYLDAVIGSKRQRGTAGSFSFYNTNGFTPPSLYQLLS